MKELRDEKTYRALLMLFAVLLLRYFRNAWFESESVCYSLSFYEFFFQDAWNQQYVSYNKKALIINRINLALLLY